MFFQGKFAYLPVIVVTVNVSYPGSQSYSY